MVRVPIWLVAIALWAVCLLAVQAMPADDGGRPLGYQQLQLRSKVQRWRVAALFNPWHQRDLDIQMRWVAAESAELTVTGPDFVDTWRWQEAPDGATRSPDSGQARSPGSGQAPSTLRGERQGGFAITVGPRDRAPLQGPPVTAGAAPL